MIRDQFEIPMWAAARCACQPGNAEGRFACASYAPPAASGAAHCSPCSAGVEDFLAGVSGWAGWGGQVGNGQISPPRLTDSNSKL